MTIVWIIAAVMLIAAAAITMFRLLAGPSTLDRLVALDTFVAVTMCAHRHLGGLQPGHHRDLQPDGAGVDQLRRLGQRRALPRARHRRVASGDRDEQSSTSWPAVLVLAGSTLALTAAIGVVRFPDTLSRMHAATKPQVLGLLLVLVGAAIRLRGHADVGMLILAGAVHPHHRAGGGQPGRPTRLPGAELSRRPADQGRDARLPKRRKTREPNRRRQLGHHRGRGRHRTERGAGASRRIRE